MAGDTPNDQGAVNCLHRLVAALFAVVQNRLELATVEISEETSRWIRVLFWGAAFFFLVMMAVIFLTLAVVAGFIDPLRPAAVVLAAFGLAYVLGAAGTGLVLRKRLKNWPPLLADTIAEIKKDHACFLARKP